MNCKGNMMKFAKDADAKIRKIVVDELKIKVKGVSNARLYLKEYGLNLGSIKTIAAIAHIKRLKIITTEPIFKDLAEFYRKVHKAGTGKASPSSSVVSAAKEYNQLLNKIETVTKTGVWNNALNEYVKTIKEIDSKNWLEHWYSHPYCKQINELNQTNSWYVSMPFLKTSASSIVKNTLTCQEAQLFNFEMQRIRKCKVCKIDYESEYHILSQYPGFNSHHILRHDYDCKLIWKEMVKKHNFKANKETLTKDDKNTIPPEVIND
uniref:Phage_int_SAM_5 domain-containing protein n=1 Tax=Strongyloides venezuelensis TaxID=75913 RepID=A0A0K0FAV2_STRVS